MQKISSYLYPNRVQLLADLAGFNVEYTNVYQRNVKIYNGIDNTIEFDIKNADQKRIDLTTLTQLQLNIMDAAGNALPNSPYDLTVTAVKGIASVLIPQEDLVDLTPQFLKFSVTALKNGVDVMLYADTRFGAVGTMELVGNAMPTFKDDRVYTDFAGEINLAGNVISHTPAIATKFYEAVPTTTFDIKVDYTGFVGEIYLEATSDMTISVNSYLNGRIATILPLDNNERTGSITTTVDLTGTDYNYVRVSWEYPNIWSSGIQTAPMFGKVTKVTVLY